MPSRLTDAAVLGGAIGLALLAVQHFAHWGPSSGQRFAADRERCYGVVRAARNDCGTAHHACAGQATQDRGEEEWLMLPAGTCERIPGGRAWGKAPGDAPA
ncbi:MAG: DUF2282 domain-containing protein [Zoogloeaceae bacterium]|nr:DUF2282 domain-containing protein [Zoogloeaceae bacterium]